jgi:hypothetical protein
MPGGIYVPDLGLEQAISARDISFLDCHPSVFLVEKFRQVLNVAHDRKVSDTWFMNSDDVNRIGEFERSSIRMKEVFNQTNRFSLLVKVKLQEVEDHCMPAIHIRPQIRDKIVQIGRGESNCLIDGQAHTLLNSKTSFRASKPL